jgi:DNA-binding NarL/FixJ family response regulator
MNILRIGLVDDKIKLLSSLKDKLSLFEDLEVVWTACNSHETFAWLQQKPVDIILMDIEMPGMDGIQTTAKIKSTNPEIKIIMLTVFDSNDKIFDAILAGASGYLLKDETLPKLHQSILEVNEGGAPMSPMIAYKALQLINNLHKTSAGEPEPAPVEHDLTEREMEILQNLSKGLSYNEIADRLFISSKTVRNHLYNIYQKLQISSNIEAVNIAHRNKWV